MNNERGGGQACKMAALRRTDYVVHKKKIWFIQEPLDEKTFTWIRKKFEQRECSNGKFQRKSWSLVYQFALAFLHKRKEWDFSHKGCRGRGNKDTPGSPRYWLPHISVFQAFRSWERRKEIGTEKKIARPLLFHLPFFFSFFCCMSAWRPFCIRSPEGWQLLSWLSP